MTQLRRIGSKVSRIENDLMLALWRYLHLGGQRDRAEEVLAQVFDQVPSAGDAPARDRLLGKRIPWQGTFR